MPTNEIAINDLPELDKPVALYGAIGDLAADDGDDDWLVVVVAVLTGN
mgnify:CR=1 FL=1